MGIIMDIELLHKKYMKEAGACEIDRMEETILLGGEQMRHVKGEQKIEGIS